MFPMYSEMKNSGVEWLGEIPAHWGLKRLKNAARINPEVLSETTTPDYKISYVDISSVEETEGVGSSREIKFSEAPIRARRIVKPGDTILSTVRTYLKAVAYFEAPLPNLIVSTGFAILRPGKEVSSKFLYYMVRCEEFVQAVVAHSAGVSYPAINPSELSALAAWVPTLEEQRSIVSFLDRKTALIDDLIAKRERQIDLLQEQQTALISRAVTKGLNLDVPMKDSGVEWLGKVPDQWSVAPVYSRYEVQLGKMLDEKQITGKHLAPYLRNVDVQWDRINITDLPLMDFDPIDCHKFSLKSGDILVCEGGEVGRAAIWVGDMEGCYYQKALHRVRPRTGRDDPRFFFFLLYAASKNDAFIVGGNQTTIGHLTADKLRKHRFPFPSRKEQGEISAVLDRETAKIGTFVTKIRLSIEKLREYRQSLISAAVTGKIDVRNWGTEITQ